MTMISKVFVLVSLAALIATTARAQLAPPSLSNSVTYQDWTSTSAICSVPNPPFNYSTATQTVTNTNPVALSGVSGSITSTLTYLGATIQSATTGCSNITSGSVGTVTAATTDIVTFSGGTGSGTGTAVLNFGNSKATSAQYGGAEYVLTAEMDAGPGSGNNIFDSGYGLTSNELADGGGVSVSQACDWGGCSYNAATNQYLIPFSFPYGVPLHFGINELRAGAANGASVSFTGSISFILPACTIITAQSGTNYPVQYSSSGTCGNGSGSDGATTDGPLPLWALSVLGACLLGISARRLKNAA